MNETVVTDVRTAAERQVHAAISHFRAGEFECAITLSSAAEGMLPTPADPAHLFAQLRQAAPDDNFNFAATWLKHNSSPETVEIGRTMVLFWLYRAISKYWMVYGGGTSEMIALFPWAAHAPGDRMSG